MVAVTPQRRRSEEYERTAGIGAHIKKINLKKFWRFYYTILVGKIIEHISCGNEK